MIRLFNIPAETTEDHLPGRVALLQRPTLIAHRQASGLRKRIAVSEIEVMMGDITPLTMDGIVGGDISCEIQVPPRSPIRS